MVETTKEKRKKIKKNFNFLISKNCLKIFLKFQKETLNYDSKFLQKIIVIIFEFLIATKKINYIINNNFRIT